jgi:hypothetical protein
MKNHPSGASIPGIHRSYPISQNELCVRLMAFDIWR